MIRVYLFPFSHHPRIAAAACSHRNHYHRLGRGPVCVVNEGNFPINTTKATVCIVQSLLKEIDFPALYCEFFWFSRGLSRRVLQQSSEKTLKLTQKGFSSTHKQVHTCFNLASESEREEIRKDLKCESVLFALKLPHKQKKRETKAPHSRQRWIFHFGVFPLGIVRECCCLLFKQFKHNTAAAAACQGIVNFFQLTRVLARSCRLLICSRFVGGKVLLGREWERERVCRLEKNLFVQITPWNLSYARISVIKHDLPLETLELKRY